MVTFAQAQERAERWVNGDVPAYLQREVCVREFDLGFVVWAEDREDGPTGDGGRLRLVIARDSGETTLWPALPVGEVIRRYEEEYGAVEEPVNETPEPPKRVDLNATSFLLSPPEWLQEAADAMGIPDRRPSSGPSSGSSSSGSSPAEAPADAAAVSGADDAAAGPAAAPEPEPEPEPVPVPVSEASEREASAVATDAGDAEASHDPAGTPDDVLEAGAPADAVVPDPQESADMFAKPSADVSADAPASPEATQAPVEWPSGGDASEAPAGAEPWAGADVSGDDGDDHVVGLPATVLTPALSGVDVDDTPPPSVRPEAKTALMPQGSALPRTTIAPAVGGPAAPATPPVAPAAPVAPVTPAAPAAPNAVPNAAPAAAPGAPAGGYVRTQMVAQLDESGQPVMAAPAAPPTPQAPPAPPATGGAHAAATMLASPGGPMPPAPPGAPAAPGRPPAAPHAPQAPGVPGVPAAPQGARPVHAAATMLASPGGPGAPQAPGVPAAPQVPQPPQAPAPAYGYPQAPTGLPTVGPGYMAVLRYRAHDGSEQQIIRRSAPGTPHPEWQILHELRAMNVPPQQVLELHTELESCDLPGGYCARMIRETWPQVRISHTAAYGRDHATRQQGVRHLVEHQGELHQVADGPARPAPNRVPLPHPQQIQMAPPVGPDVIGRELAEAFGPQVFRFDQRAVSRQGVPDIVAQTLVWAGLPADFGPFFWGQAQPGRPVPTLAELAAERGVRAAADAGSYLVMGSDYGRQLCVQYGTAHIVAVPMESPDGQPAPPQFVNTSLPQFVRSLALLGKMWRWRYGLTPEQAGRWTVDFQDQLAALDPAALSSPENWWAVLLEQMWDGLF
ncbi:SUKH-4 family immunity protein [Streptomyces triculaminicus]|uniref:SUKH-4 family immunity protein n=1 Tax=Streptomyces triculaminicus TaxID=2816232 RepID=UPI0037D73366